MSIVVHGCTISGFVELQIDPIVDCNIFWGVYFLRLLIYLLHVAAVASSLAVAFNSVWFVNLPKYNFAVEYKS